ncbi:hypothetical protein P3T43_003960 [Paraburkholderia sp. GAS41]|uniref:hypothetical protein n=1 Tax=Paraburkholderia sp. GAS41 TaxID=3035134 RepID=UPI003D2373A2
MNIREQINLARHSVVSSDGVLHGRRKIKFGSPAGRSALFYSTKNGAFIPVRTRLQFTYCFFLEADPNVSAYRTAAIEIDLGARKLFPDFLVWDAAGQPFVRCVIHSTRAASPCTLSNHARMARALSAANVGFELVTEKELGPRSATDWLKQAYNRGGSTFTREVTLSFALDMLERIPAEERTVSTVQSYLYRDNLPCGSLEAALFHGRLRIKDNGPIVPDALVEMIRAD